MLSNIKWRNYNIAILFVPEANHKKSNATKLEIKIRTLKQSFLNVALKVQTYFVNIVVILTKKIPYITRSLIPRSFIVGCSSCFIARFHLVIKKDCLGIWKKSTNNTLK